MLLLKCAPKRRVALSYKLCRHIRSNPDVIRRDAAGKLGTPADAMTHVPRRTDSPKNISAASARPDSNYFISSKPLRRLSYCP
jgi:hypothetical protein